MKYKLLRDYPPYKKNDVLEEKTEGIFGMKGKISISGDILGLYPDWFEPVLFTTHDGISVVPGMKIWKISDNAKDRVTIKYDYVETPNENMVYIAYKENVPPYIEFFLYGIV